MKSRFQLQTYFLPISSPISYWRLSLAALLVMITACAPADRKLVSNLPTGNPGTLNRGLRVGAFGQTIWVAQNLEQAGTLINTCLRSKVSVQKTTEGFNQKFCRMTFRTASTEGLMAPLTSEKWDVTVVYQDEAESKPLRIFRATGKSLNGYSAGVYKGQNAYIRHDMKGFLLDSNSETDFRIEVSSSGQLALGNEILRFDHSTQALGAFGEADGRVLWQLVDVDHELVFLERSQRFNIGFKKLKLIWTTPICADFEGVAMTQEGGQSPVAIEVIPAQARRTTEPGRRGGWSQNLRTCQGMATNENAKRSQTILNFDFLFF
jgi:hypothetical protein